MHAVTRREARLVEARAQAAAWLGVTLLLVAGCSSADTNPSAATTLTVAGGDTQSGPVGTEVPTDLLVKVTDANGKPVSDVAVNFTATGGATFVGASETTNSDGIAQNTMTFGTIAGTDTVFVSVASITTSLIMTEHATAGNPTTISIFSGNNQTATHGTLLPAPLVVLVNDRYGNVVPNAMVDWSTTFGIVSSQATLSDSTGKAQTTWTLPAATGTDTTIAALNGTGSVLLFTAIGN